MKHRFALPALLAVLLGTLGIAQLVSAQRSSTVGGIGTSPFQTAAITAGPSVNAVVRAMGEAGNVIAGPALIEGTGPVTGVLGLYRHGTAAADLVLTVHNSGNETIQITTSLGQVWLIIPPGHSVSASNNTSIFPTGGYSWNCPGSGTYQFSWVVRKL